MKNEDISRNTKNALTASLKRAMKKKPFPQITVSELTRDCGVNRNTFYYHFEDMYALLRWMLQEEALGVVERLGEQPDYKAAILFVMEYVEQNDYIISCVHDSISYDEMRRLFYADVLRIMASMIDAAAERVGEKPESRFREFAVKFYTEAFLGILVDWAKNGFVQSREQIVSFLSMILENGLRNFDGKGMTEEA